MEMHGYFGPSEHDPQRVLEETLRIFWLHACLDVQRKLLRVRKGCQASQNKGLTSGEVRETSGKVWGTSGEPPWIAVEFHSERPSGEVATFGPQNFQGSLGNFRGSPGTVQKLRGTWLPPSDSPNVSLRCLGARVSKHDPLANRIASESNR